MESSEIEQYRQALAFLAGLHPGLTTDDPMAQAEAIFDHVTAERAALQHELARAENNAQHFLAEWQRAIRPPTSTTRA